MGVPRQGPGPAGISNQEALELLSLEGWPRTLDLFKRASEAKEAFSGKRVSSCSIVNARCGNCPENCAFCAQSSRSKARIQTWPLISPDEIFKAAKDASGHGASRFGIVTSGRALSLERELAQVCEAVSRIARELSIKPCASLGILGAKELSMLKDAGLDRYHHNLETAPSHFPEICSTRGFDTQTATVRAAKSVGLSVCSGGIFGLGESLPQRVELLDAVRGLGVDSVPINFLSPIPGTPLESAPPMTPLECLKVVAVARLMTPSTSIRVCGGREVRLRDFQSMLFAAGADSLMVGGYLVTPGRDVAADLQMIKDAGLGLE